MNLRTALRRTAKVGLALLVVLLATVALGGFVATRFPTTPAFQDETGGALPGSIAAFERVELGGLRQTVLMRGKRVSNPVLLYLHGGPGSSELALVRHFNAALEDHFIVVLWEQRGAGKSYSPFIDPSSMTIDQFVSDAEELARWLGRRFGKDRIYLVGHSWGSLVGLRLAHQHPELFHAYVGIGQAVSFQEGERLSLRWTMEQAQAAQNLEAIAELRSLEDYPNGDGGGLGAVFTERKWLGRFGGVMHGQQGLEGLFAISPPPEFTSFDFAPFGLGSLFSLRTLWPQILKSSDLRETANRLDLPVYLVTGRHDYNVPCTLTEDYFNRLAAPRKTLVWFEQSAHMPNFEEPEKFNRLMIDQVLPETSPR